MTYCKKLYLLIIHVVLISLVLTSPVLVPLKARFGWYGSENNSMYYTMINIHQRQIDQLPEQSLFLLGDSIVQGIWTPSVASNAINLGVANDTSLGLLERLQRYSGLEKAGLFWVSIGINDIKRRSVNDILRNYDLIIKELPKNTPIVIAAVLPIDQTVIDVSWNEHVFELNEGLLGLLGQCGRCVFVNVPQEFMSSNGLNSTFHEGDGIHLNSHGYAVWLEALLQASKGV